ncbi:hypothetical protein DPMN_063825 [Dreissena polymorpha]|uniref:Uncharacterized protein n=1 Tax=Dreissena polymorpha TaxID=45954 RepID=A0A9D4CCI7_DREPO|nr:hypothetical protein DPMN_063825 [Dreissena polymorpha]
MEDEHDTNKRTVSCLPGMPALPRETGTRNKVRVPSSKLNLCTRRASINSDLTRRSKNSRDRRLVTYLQRDYSLISSSFTSHPNVEVGVCVDVCLMIWVR